MLAEMRHAVIGEGETVWKPNPLIRRHRAVFTWIAATRPGFRTRYSSGVRKSICAQKWASSSVWPKSL